MIPFFIESWSDEKHTDGFSYKTYRNGDNNYVNIEIYGKVEIQYRYGDVKVVQLFGKELSAQAIYEIVEIIYKDTTSFEKMASERYEALKKIRSIKIDIKNRQHEIKKLEKFIVQLDKNNK